MEYVVFLAIVLAVTLFFGVFFGLIGSRRAKPVARPVTGKGFQAEPAEAPGHGTARTRGGSVPWGWPGNTNHGQRVDAADAGDVFGLWVDQVLAQKRTVDDPEYRDRAHRSLRALIEDRYGRSADDERRSRVNNPERTAGSPRAPDGARAPAPMPSLSRVRTPWGW